jgi:hypothetical protein
MKAAANPPRALAQLVAARGKHLGQHGLRRSLVERYRFLAKTRTTIDISEQDYFGELRHGLFRLKLNA